MTQLFRRKPIAELTVEGERSLKRVLGAGDLMMLAIGAVIGAGIFVAIGTAAAGQVDARVTSFAMAPARRWSSPFCCSAVSARSPASATPSSPR